jgi:hypothetical protein
MSQQLLSYHLKQAIAKRYFSKADYDLWLSKGKVKAEAKAASKAAAEAQAIIDAEQAKVKARERAEHLAKLSEQAAIDKAAAEAAKVEQQRIKDQQFAIQKAQWESDHPEAAAANKAQAEKSAQRFMDLINAAFKPRQRPSIPTIADEID